MYVFWYSECEGDFTLKGGSRKRGRPLILSTEQIQLLLVAT